MGADLSQLFRTLLLIVGALFPIVNPLGNAPIFLSLTRGFSSATRAVLAWKIALNGFVLLVVSILIGTHILAFFGISLPVVQVGGGLVVIATGWSLLNREDDDEELGDSKKSVTSAKISERAFYPLTLPLTVGPGSISVAITVGANQPQGVPAQWPVLVAAVAGAAVVAVTIYLSYRFAERIARALGETAMKVLIRLSSFILLCIGVQILWNGLSVLLRSVMESRG
ncbi:MAG TPA: MarC family protein [Bryobacteraceae bacterium]|nr:MarC family protein [Bryobacteraceae bacterium]